MGEMKYFCLNFLFIFFLIFFISGFCIAELWIFAIFSSLVTLSAVWVKFKILGV